MLRGGAPVWSCVPPWQKRQLVRHDCGEAGVWQPSHDTPELPPERSAPWQARQSCACIFISAPCTVGAE